jgi:uncharacterized membrane protein
MLWVILALSAYFLFAVVEIIDKKILSSPLLNPLTYAFYAGLLVCFSFLFWPFDFSFLSPIVTFFAIASGASFFIAIYFLYSAITKGEISRVISIVGGLSPIIIFIFSYFFLEERLGFFSLVALFMLVVGSVSLSFEKDGKKFIFRKHFFLDAFLAALFFAVSYGLTKAVFLNTSFLNGFIWVRVGTFICVVFVFLMPKLRRRILESSRRVSRRLTTLFFFDKGISALGHIILNYAVKLGSVAIVNALQGAEYAFIFILTLCFSLFLPRIFYESLAPKHLIHKMLGIALVCGGVVLLFLDGNHI